MKPKRTIATRYIREEEQARASTSGNENESQNFQSTRSTSSSSLSSSRSSSRSGVDANKNKKRGLPDFIDIENYDLVVNNLESDKKQFQKELVKLRKSYVRLTSELKLKKKENADLKRLNKDLQKNINDLKENNGEFSESSRTSQEKISSLNKANDKLKQQITSLQNEIRKLNVQNENNFENKDKLLEVARQSCKAIFNSKIHSNFVQQNSNLITDIVKLYESCSHGDKTQHCPAIQFMNSVPEPITSPSLIEHTVSSNVPPSKKRKIDNSVMSIDKHYSKNSLKELVMDLEPRHSDEYDLWRNVLWALNQYGREREYDTLQIADCFSRRSSKYKNLRDVKKTFDSSDGTLSLQYLIEISKIYEEGLDAITEYLNTILPSRYLPLTINQVDIRDRHKFELNVNFDDGDESHTLLIIPDLLVVGDEDGKRLCFLEKTITSKNPELASLCPEMEKGFVLTLNKKLYEFQARKDPSTTMKLHRPLKPNESYIILPSGKRDNKELHLIEIRKALRAEAIKLLSAKSGKKFGDDKDDNNIFTIPDEDSDVIRTDLELVEALIDADPDMMSRYCHSGKTIYHCKPSTNLWCTLTEMGLDSHLRKNLKTTLKLTKKELKYISMCYAIVRIRNLTLSKIEDIDFPGLDSKLHLFITDNKTIVTSSIPPTIRNIEKDDLAEITCGWSYNYELSMKHMESVKSYFDKLIPRQSEREWFLSFVAKMLNGQRMNECFLALTTSSEGKHGISTLITLLSTVFGNYFIANNKFVVLGGIRDNNQYDGGIYNLKGKRLLLADKLQKTDTLNCDFIKTITSKPDYYIEYKKKFSRTQLKFPVQAGLIITFNEDDVPKFNKKDQDFVKRMVAFPMRSRFLSKQDIKQLNQKGEEMTDIYIADDSLKLQFPEWRSALLDLLIKYYNESLPPISDSIVDCTKTLCSANYDYYDWLDSHVRRSDNNREFVTAKDIMRIIKKSDEHHPREMEKLKTAMSVWANKNGFHYKARHVYPVSNKRRTEAKSAMMNCRLDNIDEE